MKLLGLALCTHLESYEEQETRLCRLRVVHVRQNFVDDLATHVERTDARQQLSFVYALLPIPSAEKGDRERGEQPGLVCSASCGDSFRTKS